MTHLSNNSSAKWRCSCLDRANLLEASSKPCSGACVLQQIANMEAKSSNSTAILVKFVSESVKRQRGLRRRGTPSTRTMQSAPRSCCTTSCGVSGSASPRGPSRCRRARPGHLCCRRQWAPLQTRFPGDRCFLKLSWVSGRLSLGRILGRCPVYSVLTAWCSLWEVYEQCNSVYSIYSGFSEFCRFWSIYYPDSMRYSLALAQDQHSVSMDPAGHALGFLYSPSTPSHVEERCAS